MKVALSKQKMERKKSSANGNVFCYLLWRMSDKVCLVFWQNGLAAMQYITLMAHQDGRALFSVFVFFCHSNQSCGSQFFLVLVNWHHSITRYITLQRDGFALFFLSQKIHNNNNPFLVMWHYTKLNGQHGRGTLVRSVLSIFCF